MSSRRRTARSSAARTLEKPEKPEMLVKLVKLEQLEKLFKPEKTENSDNPANSDDTANPANPEPSAEEDMELQTQSDKDSTEKEQSDSSESGEKSVQDQEDETKNQQTENEDTENQESDNQENQQTENQDTENQEMENQESDNQENLETENQETENHEMENQDTENLEPNEEQMQSDDDEGEKENQAPDGAKTKDYRCNHPGVILNPVYLCVPCDFRTRKFDSLTEHNEEAHPGDTTFKYRKMSEDGKTLLEQTIDETQEQTVEENQTVEEKQTVEENPEQPMEETQEQAAEEKQEMSSESGSISTGVTSPESLLNDTNRPSEQIRALSINGTVIIPESNMLRDTSHVSPLLQRPPNFSCVPQIAVPLNTYKYNPSLDDNMTLIASFNKFPYPTHAELSWLTAASKHPEEQIRVWFTTQRLKQGITWSPEEVEEARKKMFNGSIPPAHNTFTVLPTSPVPKATVHTTTVESPRNGLKRILNAAALFGPDAKRPVMAVAPNHGEKGLMAPPPLPPPLQKPSDAKRANEIKRTVPLMQPPQKNKMMPSVPNNAKLKQMPLASMPSMVFPESLTRPMIAPPPIFAPSFKGTILVPRGAKEKAPISLPNGMLTSSAPLIPPQIRRPAIIQTIRANPGLPPNESLNGESNGFQKNGHVEDPSDFQHKASVLTQFPLLERMKGKTSEQLKVLEENFLRNSFPSHSEVESLSASTRLSAPEVESWFCERRALRDNLEQALLNSMGTKRNGNLHLSPENQRNGSLHLGTENQRNGVLHLGTENQRNGSLHLSPENQRNGSLETNNQRNGNLHLSAEIQRNGNLHLNPENQRNGNLRLNPENQRNGTLRLSPEKHNGLKHAAGPLGFPLGRVPEDLVSSRWSFADDLSQRWFNGKAGSVLPGSELIGPRCHDLTNGRAQEAELSWFNKALSSPQHDHFRFRQPPFELQTGGMFGRWIDRRQDLSEESSG
ncbi:hypothetical protein WMY93_032358 [Mugilogobius chulae]|uniref:Homeobox domain-containing protein n=1 Tax=Mugilogobius chulae TaxID=88201 RepID=A0AAW0MSL5_9GOBI